MTNLRVTFLCDYTEEGWPSMNLVGRELPRAVASLDPSVQIGCWEPRARRWFGVARPDNWSPSIRDRLINRYIYYPRWLRRQERGQQVFHVVDHTYAHLVHELPAGRTIVTCHDLDAFACVMDRDRSPRPWLFRRAVRRTLAGLQRAAVVACVSETVRDALTGAGLIGTARTIVVPNGIHPAFTTQPGPRETAEVDRLLGTAGDGLAVDLLHVGIPIERKRIDVALNVLAHVRRTWPSARLIRVGGALPAHLRDLARRLDVHEHVLELPFLRHEVLAAVYRRADVVLVPSDGEGFALPIVEALASGTPVLANDLPVLRETGGCLARYRSTSDTGGWMGEIATLLMRSREDTEAWRVSARARAARFTWRKTAEALLPVYRELNAR